eukprot:351470-Chlamydomonas_euryale.AAC.2
MRENAGAGPHARKVHRNGPSRAALLHHDQAARPAAGVPQGVWDGAQVGERRAWVARWRQKCKGAIPRLCQISAAATSARPIRQRDTALQSHGEAAEAGLMPLRLRCVFPQLPPPHLRPTRPSPPQWRVLPDGRQMKFRRIDGATPLDAREAAIKEFNAPDSDVFIFLLSIRAAGRGLNLQTSDTVIIYDPDPNPKNEEQAIARSHRIGQKKEVCAG